MSQLGLILQESLRAETEARTILGLLTDRMDGVDRGQRRRRSLKERLRFTGMGCCGATWVFRPVALTFRHAQEQEQAPETGEVGGRTPPSQQEQQHDRDRGPDPNPFGLECVRPSTSGSGMNLAAALAAERQLRGTQEADARGVVEGSETPWRVSLMRLLEERDVIREGEGEGVSTGNDWVCCVCMGRKKGAAFIPCGHTFCRVCSREVWLNRPSCPLCNRSILDILHIF